MQLGFNCQELQFTIFISKRFFHFINSSNLLFGPTFVYTLSNSKKGKYEKGNFDVAAHLWCLCSKAGFQ
jgi:hypothetical protein